MDRPSAPSNCMYARQINDDAGAMTICGGAAAIEVVSDGILQGQIE